MFDDSVQREVSLDLDPEEVWELVGDADGLGTWLADEVDLDVVPDAEGTAREGDVVREVRVERVEPGRELAFRWWPRGDEGLGSSVVITVAPSDGGTLLRVVETRMSAATPRALAGTGRVSGLSVQWEVRALLLWAGTARLAVR